MAPAPGAFQRDLEQVLGVGLVAVGEQQRKLEQVGRPAAHEVFE